MNTRASDTDDRESAPPRAEPVAAKKRTKRRASARATPDESLLDALRRPLAKTDFSLLFEPLAAARALAPAVRAATFAQAASRKEEPTQSVLFVRALAAIDAPRPRVREAARAANAALDALRASPSWHYLHVAPEVLRLAEFAGPARLDEVLRFYEGADLTIDGLLEKLVARAESRGEDPAALRLLAEHAPVVRPIVRALCDEGTSPEDARRARDAALALDGDARFAFDQLLSGSATRHSDLAWPSLERLLTAPIERRVQPRALRHALATLRYSEGIERQLALTAARDEARARLTEMLDDECPEYALELALRALKPYAASEPVFARVRDAFARPGRLAGSLSSEWFRARSDGAWALVSDEQAHEVIDGMIRAKLAGVTAAHHALFYASHPGCERRILAELDRIVAAPKARKEDDELYWSLVFALGHIGTDSALAAVRALAFDATDEGVWECCAVLGETLTNARFDQHVTAALARTADAARALSVLCAACEHFLEKGPLANERDRLLLALGQAAAGTENPRAPYAAHVILEGIAAALRRLDPDAALALAAALSIEKTPTKPRSLPKAASRFHELRKEPTVSPFAGEDGEKLLRRWAEAKSGAMQRRIERARHGAIEGRLTDDKLGAAAGVAVRERLVSAPDEAWFLGEDKRLHVVERSGPAAESALLAGAQDSPAPLLDGETMDERLTLWSKGAQGFIEAQRYGASLFVCRGANNGWPERHVLRFHDAARAQAAMATLRAHPPKEHTVAADPWYADGHGGVSRRYSLKKRDGEGFDTSAWVVVGAEDEDARRAEVERLEARALIEGGTLETVEWLERLQRRTDRSVSEWLRERARDDARDALWHLEALRAAQRALALVGIGPAVEVQWEGPASEADVAALERVCGAVPERVRECWAAVATAGYRTERSAATMLSPRAVIVRRPEWAELVEAMGTPDPALATSWPLVTVERDGVESTQTVFDGAATGPAARPFTNVDSALWWEESLAWALAAGMLAVFVNDVTEAEPALHVACVGAKAHEIERHALTLGATKWWRLIRVDRAVGVWTGREGARPKFERTLYATEAEAREAAESAVRTRKRHGYTD